MSVKQTWVRASSAGARGGRPGDWHLVDVDGRPWCGRPLHRSATAACQSAFRPPGAVCRACLRAERAAARAAVKEEQARLRAERPVRWWLPLRPQPRPGR